jgi:predicted TPR repeat methyltransferase
MTEKEKWDCIYATLQSQQLPWYNLPLLKHTKDFLDSISPKELLLVTGCGLGDTAKQLSQAGMTNIIGTDISTTAIKCARKKFPKIRFESYDTRTLQQHILPPANTIDWLNIHQISPKDLSSYLSSLQKVSSRLLITYFYNEDEPHHKQSMVHNGNTYNHDPAKVSDLLIPLRKMKETSFSLRIKYGSKTMTLKTIKQVYVA